jgi:AraC family transcriptional regulator of adaptative response/methylated-DNA-[protein]-cysteine methyltransferase
LAGATDRGIYLLEFTERRMLEAQFMNRIAIVIPCHRVVNKDGNLCGYGGGLWRKRILLELERVGASSVSSLRFNVADQ